MKELFVTVLNMSFTATITVISVVIIRTMLKKAPKIFSYILWSVVLFRLLVPFSFETSISLMPENTESITEIAYLQNYKTTETEPSNNPDIIYNTENKSNVITDTNNNLKNISEAQVPVTNPEKPSEKSMNTFLEIGWVIWILGVFILISYSIITYSELSSNLATATSVRDNIFESDRINTPFVIGLVKPKIIIPLNLKETELKYILAHERIHISRRDNIIKPLAFLALIIHWFNPAIWLFYYLMVKDMEMSCDESVMNKTKEDIRENYSYSLLLLSVKQRGLLTPLAFGESNVKSRIKNILNYKKPSFWMMAVLVILLIIVALSFGTNPKKNAYEFSGITCLRGGDEYFYVEDTPDSIQEELVYLNFLYTVEKDYDKKYDIISERHWLSIDNEKKNADPDIYSGYVLHSISTVDKEAGDNAYIIEKYNLSEFEIINVIYTKKDSLNLTVLGPQWGDGTYSRDYVVGKTAEDKKYKIYDFLMPSWADYSEINSEILSSTIQLYTYENYEMIAERAITNTVSKANISMLLISGDAGSIESTGDVPKTGHYIKAVLNDKVYYVYEINSKYYIEKPNEHISNITFDEYRTVTNYNTLGTLPEPVFISTVISGITSEDYKATGNDNTGNPNLNDFRKIQFKLYIEYPNKIKNKKVEIPDLQMLKMNDEENRLRGGSSLERDNEIENFAVYEYELIFDAKGLNNDDIINILNSKEASASWTDGNNYTFEYNYNLGETAEFVNN